MAIDSTNLNNAAACYYGYEQDSGTPSVVQEPSRYVIGFSSPLSGLCVRFAEPLYGIRVCVSCGALRPRVKILPCAHMLCLSCRDKHLIKAPGGHGSETQVWCSRHHTLRPASRLRSAKLLGGASAPAHRLLSQLGARMPFRGRTLASGGALRHLLLQYPCFAVGAANLQRLTCFYITSSADGDKGH
ncbi:hypothetical protein MRX96_042843 [Rhipicephalus microplus]